MILSFFSPIGEEMLQRLAVGVARLHLERALGPQHRVGIDRVAVVGDDKVREPPLRKAKHHGHRVVKISET